MKGFTLSEVLIILGIIGVVATLTLPSLIANYQKKQTAIRLKKTYSELTQVIMLSEIDNGSLENWNYSLSAAAFLDTYLAKYLKNLKAVSTTTIDNKLHYKFLDGTRAYNTTTLTGHSLLSINGVHVSIGSFMFNDAKDIMIDINGEKGPNTYGKDFFLFVISAKHGLIPNGSAIISGMYANPEHLTRNELINGNRIRACRKDGYGYWCAALIMQDGWEIKDDYPW
ncbi:MAG: type II secretion system GspH family protein [Heliobacteriaceae bacterium]|jgi:type II secretory pathway pseudopilin PulG|nr:type II secretion system GspH family protein [Heliobacteriaceae bacterium]